MMFFEGLLQIFGIVVVLLSNAMAPMTFQFLNHTIYFLYV